MNIITELERHLNNERACSGVKTEKAQKQD